MKEIDGRGLLALIDAGDADDASGPVLLDVREPWEFAVGSIGVGTRASVSMPMGTVPSRVSELDPSQSIVCICHQGMRSAQVVAWLEGQGFEAVYNLAGGTDAWSLDVDPSLPRY